MIIVLSNQKGGVGKTTTAITLWAALPNSLGIDLDTQCNFTVAIEADRTAPRTIYDVLTGQCSALNAVKNLRKTTLLPIQYALLN